MFTLTEAGPRACQCVRCFMTFYAFIFLGVIIASRHVISVSGLHLADRSLVKRFRLLRLGVTICSMTALGFKSEPRRSSTTIGYF